jgi:acyl-CoA thioester hydrolase
MHETEVPIRFTDLDAAGHVNNATYATYAEEARIAYCRDVLDAPVESLAFVVASLNVTFERPIGDIGTVRVETSVPELGETSFPMHYEINFDGEVVATAETTQVAIDPTDMSPRPLPDPWREAISAHEGL